MRIRIRNSIPGNIPFLQVYVYNVEDEKTNGVARAEFRRTFFQLTLIEIVQTITLISFNLFNGLSSRPCRISLLIFLIKTHAVATCLPYFLLWNIHYLKVPKCEIFDQFFLAPINPIWVGDLRTGEKKFFVEDHGRYLPFCFFYAGWACAKNFLTQAEPALKNCLRRLSLR
jgi:hypothetical protein